MISIEVEVGGKRFKNIEDAFKDLGDKLEHALDEAPQLLGRALGEALQQVAKKLYQMHGNPWDGSVASGSQYLQSRSGQGLKEIKESIQTKISKGEEIVSGQISAGSLAFHEEGGTITARNSKYLTIPLPAALDSRGVPLRERATDWDNTFVKRSRNGNLLIFRKTPGSKNLTPLYLLKTSVTIPPRLHMEDTINSAGVPYFENKALEEISALLEKM